MTSLWWSLLGNTKIQFFDCPIFCRDFSKLYPKFYRRNLKPDVILAALWVKAVRMGPSHNQYTFVTLFLLNWKQKKTISPHNLAERCDEAHKSLFLYFLSTNKCSDYISMIFVTAFQKSFPGCGISLPSGQFWGTWSNCGFVFFSTI